jgi:hypothetical protein
MKKLKVYLDTSIINFLRADDAPAYKNAAKILFNDIIVPNKINTYISRVLLEEIDDATNEKIKKELQGFVNKIHGYNYPFRLANPLEVQYDE